MNESGLIAHKMRVHLNNRQSSWMRQNCVAGRLAYNFAIEKLNTRDKEDKKNFPTAFSVSKQWTQERDTRYPWMREQGLNLDSISGVFANRYGAALNQWKVAKYSPDKVPTFHNRSHKLSITMRGRIIKRIDNKTFSLPNNRGTFRLGCPLRFDGEVRSVTFSHEGGKWYAAFLIKPAEALPVPAPAPESTAIGVDVGVAQFASLSNGEVIPAYTDYQKDLEKLKKLQRALDRMQKPIKNKQRASNNYRKQQQKVAKQHRHIANARRHYIECASKELSANYQTIAIEDLRIKNMTASAKGDAETPGKNVAQKSGLNRSILNGGFYQFRERLEAKAYERGGQVIAVNAAYTSQTCAACGFVSKENRKTQAEFECIECGHTANADTNAAQNILLRATA